MAIVVINEDEIKQIKKFEIKCLKCDSKNIEIEIDWASYPSCSWDKTTLICKDCHEDEKIREKFN